MTLHLIPLKRPRNVTETRLRLGAVVLKTCDPDAKHGSFWTYPDTGRLAAASVCHRLERLGLLETVDGLFPGLGQTYRLKPVQAFTRGEGRKPPRRRQAAGADRSRPTPQPADAHTPP
jgi:hypothetical protein